MDRPSLRYGYLAIVLALAASILSSGGCRNALATAMWVAKGTNRPAEYDGLKGKKVVVVCRPLADLKYRDVRVAKDLARELGRLLKRNVRKIEVIDQRKVAQWIDENVWDDYAEVGEALEAEMIVGVDLRDFTIYQGQTLYQGKANVVLSVYDCTDPGQPVFEKDLPQSVYPPNTGIPTSEKLEAEFRKEFVRVLSDQIGRHFYPHDARAYYALDATALD
ncbi:MAG: hypothetical protein ACYSWU_08095 [Planctomycetota bacterium]|jgi:hypothetical protein